MYSDVPVSWQPVLRIVLGLAWLFVALMGVYALLVPPVSTFEPTGLWLTVLWGVPSVGGSVAAVVGVIVNRSRIEEVGAWFAAAGVVVYAVTVVSLMVSNPERGAQGSALMALLFFVTYRAVITTACASVSRKLLKSDLE